MLERRSSAAGHRDAPGRAGVGGPRGVGEDAQRVPPGVEPAEAPAAVAGAGRATDRGSPSET